MIFTPHFFKQSVCNISAHVDDWNKFMAPENALHLHGFCYTPWEESFIKKQFFQKCVSCVSLLTFFRNEGQENTKDILEGIRYIESMEHADVEKWFHFKKAYLTMLENTFNKRHPDRNYCDFAQFVKNEIKRKNEFYVELGMANLQKIKDNENSEEGKLAKVRALKDKQLLER